MANENQKDFNAMLHEPKDMPKIQTITDEKSIQKYGGNRMYFAPPLDYDNLMKQIPYGKLTTVGAIREHFAKRSGADFTDPITAGIFVSIAAWASFQRTQDETPYWRTLKAGGALNPKYPGGVQAQRDDLARQVTDQRLENQKLADAIANSDDPEMQEQVARDRGYVEKEETLFVDVAN